MIPLPEDIMKGIVPPPDRLDEAWTMCIDAGTLGIPLMRAPALPGAPARRDLVREATEMAHLLTHKPANPHCEACARGKMRERPHRAGAFKRPLRGWGYRHVRPPRSA